jgi:hypothetical protein
MGSRWVGLSRSTNSLSRFMRLTLWVAASSCPTHFHGGNELRSSLILQRRILRYLQRRGRIPRTDDADPYPPEPDVPRFDQLCAASVQGRVALGPGSGSVVEHWVVKVTHSPASFRAGCVVSSNACRCAENSRSRSESKNGLRGPHEARRIARCGLRPGPTPRDGPWQGSLITVVVRLDVLRSSEPAENGVRVLRNFPRGARVRLVAPGVRNATEGRGARRRRVERHDVQVATAVTERSVRD